MILRGLWRLAKGDAGGIREFGGGLDNFYASLAPLIAFPLVGALVTALQVNWRVAVVSFLARLCGVLVLPVLVYEFARFYGREPMWLRTATALNWSFWALLPVLLVGAFIGGILAQIGLPMRAAELATLGIMAVYLLWYRWFILRAGLALNGWRAALIMLVTGALIALLTAIPVTLGLGPDPAQLSHL
ncbi:MAG TPA: hypothetical protein VLT37_09840 [Acidocella sp.]|nr:hypothetical protein [Acidocella sp.]